MKKLFVLLFAVGASVLTSCDNENSVNPQPLGTAKISGTVFAGLDETSAGFETVANIKVILEITGGGSTRFVETTTDSNGNYSVDIEIGNSKLSVKVHTVDFKHNVTTALGEVEGTFHGITTPAFDVVKGGEYIQDVTYF